MIGLRTRPPPLDEAPRDGGAFFCTCKLQAGNPLGRSPLSSGFLRFMVRLALMVFFPGAPRGCPETYTAVTRVAGLLAVALILLLLLPLSLAGSDYCYF